MHHDSERETLNDACGGASEEHGHSPRSAVYGAFGRGASRSRCRLVSHSHQTLPHFEGGNALLALNHPA